MNPKRRKFSALWAAAGLALTAVFVWLVVPTREFDPTSLSRIEVFCMLKKDKQIGLIQLDTLVNLPTGWHSPTNRERYIEGGHYYVLVSDKNGTKREATLTIGDNRYLMSIDFYQNLAASIRGEQPEHYGFRHSNQLLQSALDRIVAARAGCD